MRATANGGVKPTDIEERNRAFVGDMAAGRLTSAARPIAQPSSSVAQPMPRATGPVTQLPPNTVRVSTAKALQPPPAYTPPILHSPNRWT